MEDIFKRALYSSIGFVAILLEKMQQNIDDLINQGKISETEGRQMVEDFLGNLEVKKESLTTQVNSLSEEALSKFTWLKNQSLDELHQRIAELEVQLGFEKEVEVVEEEAVIEVIEVV